MIRRVASIVLFVLGAWLLAAEMMIAAADVGQTIETELAVIGIALVFAAPFLLLGMWLSPGNRLAELGATILAAALIGGLLGLTMFIMLSDPEFVKLMRAPNQPPNFRIAPVSGLLNLLAVAAVGWWLQRFGKRRSLTPQ